jgi:hypothetical protein
VVACESFRNLMVLCFWIRSKGFGRTYPSFTFNTCCDLSSLLYEKLYFIYILPKNIPNRLEILSPIASSQFVPKENFVCKEPDSVVGLCQADGQ